MKKYTPETAKIIPPEIDMAAVGYETGVACQQFLQGFFQGMACAMEDAALLNAAANTAVLNREESSGKTKIEDCRCCWCDICANIEVCEVYHVADEIISSWGKTLDRPIPCLGCKDGMRGEPCLTAASCGKFIKGAEHNYD